MTLMSTMTTIIHDDGAHDSNRRRSQKDRRKNGKSRYEADHEKYDDRVGSRDRAADSFRRNRGGIFKRMVFLQRQKKMVTVPDVRGMTFEDT